jgi:hypothetical protein
LEVNWAGCGPRREDRQRQDRARRDRDDQLTALMQAARQVIEALERRLEDAS